MLGDAPVTIARISCRHTSLSSARPNLKLLVRAIDMRKGRNGLAALVREGTQQDPFAPEALYVFVGRRYDVLKILGWDRNGFCVWWKKSESDEKFRWPRMLEEDVVTLTAEQLNWLLDGYDVWSAPHRMIRFTHVS
jgi:transposase